MKKLLMILGLVGLMGFTGFVGWSVGLSSRENREAQDTVRVTVTDTVPFYQPIARDSLVFRYVTRVLPTSSRENREAQDTVDAAMIMQHTEHSLADSVTVEVPISQKKYETEQYRAYVSGYEPRLDSIFVYQNTVRETVTLATKAQGTRQPRIGFGVVAGAGYGIINKQADIFVGGAVYFRIWP